MQSLNSNDGTHRSVGNGILSCRQMARTVPGLISGCRGTTLFLPFAGFSTRVCFFPSAKMTQRFSERCRRTFWRFTRVPRGELVA